MYCIGNFKLFASKSNLWRKICQKLEDQDSIGPALNVKCERHNHIVPIQTATDFLTVPDGGCTENCDFRLECGHVCPKKCHPDDEEHIEFKCKKKCERINCELEHKCRKLCWEDCGDCTVLVEKLIPVCSHRIRIACFKDPQREMCTEPCTKLLECAHVCSGLCGRPCNFYPCSEQVTVTSPCGHEVRVECSKSNDPSVLTQSCWQPCEKSLDCGHKCTKLCKSKCQVYCNVVVEHFSRCGHMLIIPCSEAQEERSKWTSSAALGVLINTKSRLENGCAEPCGQELQCGHLCLGTCGSCHQGRIHVTCKEPCGKTLVCGHQCTSPCASNCPPCRKPCENRCIHSRCRSPCGFPCVPCREPCTWRCAHKRCSRLCSEPCDRTPCDKVCPKRLRCGHTCIGMCGEPCPRKCRICDAEEVKIIFFGDEDDPCARFLQLEDCGHIFEIQGISRWVQEQANDNEIKPITCPQCRKPIRRNQRFSAAVKSSVLKIEQVKQKTFGSRIKNINCIKELLSQVQREIQYNLFNLGRSEKYSTDPEPILTSVKNLLSSRRNPLEQGTITLFENYLTYAKENRRLVKDFFKLRVCAEPKMSVSLENTCNYMGHTLWTINQVILKNMQQGSDQLMEDLTWEFHRLNLLVKFSTSFKIAFQSTSETVSNKVSEILICILSHAPFRDEDLKKVKVLLAELKEMDGMETLGITNSERLSILKAMGLKQGHWYQCPNGHVYCITECGGATVESKCNECDATIGGSAHRLRSDNRVARVMDGANHSAWSEQQNIANYEAFQEN